jgi:hypothetical protein
MTADNPQPPHRADAPPARKRRPWQFGLSTLLLVVTASAVVSWWYGRQEPWDVFQQRFTERIKELGGEIEWGNEQAPTRVSFRYWGFPNEQPLTDEKLRALRRDLGRLGPFTLNLSGSSNAPGAVTDAGLKHLDGLLRLVCLSLRHTEVTEEGLESLQRLKGLRFVDVRNTKVRSDFAPDDASTTPNGLIVWTGQPRSQFTGPLPGLSFIRNSYVKGKLTSEIGLHFGASRSVLLSPDLLYHDPEVETLFYSANEALVSLHGPISDSGVQLARIDLSTEAKVVWEVFAQPLGVDHSKYRHAARAMVYGDRCVLVSDGAATFVEIRDLETGALLERWVY